MDVDGPDGRSPGPVRAVRRRVVRYGEVQAPTLDPNGAGHHPERRCPADLADVLVSDDTEAVCGAAPASTSSTGEGPSDAATMAPEICNESCGSGDSPLRLRKFTAIWDPSRHPSRACTVPDAIRHSVPLGVHEGSEAATMGVVERGRVSKYER